MIPQRLVVRRFRSVSGELEFVFPREPGLYFMRGANGAGKSSLWDALCWVLFDRTPSGLRAGDVCSWGAGGGTEVSLDFVEDGDAQIVWTVTRTWKPNAWTLSHVAEFVTDEETVDLTKSEANPVLAMLRLSMAPFLNCVLMAQRAPMFLDLKRDQQAALFAEVMGLDRWLDLSSKASRMAAAEDDRARAAERRVSRLEGELSAIKSDDDLDRRSAEWRRQRDARLEEINAGYHSELDLLRAKKAELEEAEEAERNARAALHNAQPSATLDKAAASAQGDLDLACREHIALSKEIEALVAQRKTIADTGNCPTCRRPMGALEHKTDYRLESALKKLRGQAAECERIIDGITRRVDALKKDLDAERGALDSAREDVRAAEGRTKAARAQVARCNEELDRLERHAEAAEAEQDPYAEWREKAAADAARLARELAEAQDELNAAEGRRWMLQFWVRGFKDVRLSQIAEALAELEVEANSALGVLGLPGWEVSFDIDRETKSGTVQRGFSVSVRAPGSERAVPWEAWSGGEAQRLRLAATMGLANLVRARTGCAVPLEVWDEPSAGLTQQGVADLLGALADRARAERRVVFVVDHGAHDFGGFSGAYEVTKGLGGTQILPDA